MKVVKESWGCGCCDSVYLPRVYSVGGEETGLGRLAGSNRGEEPLGFGEPTCWCSYCQLTKT
jgi:hypothetical protein